MRLLLVSSEFPPGPGGIGTHAAQIAAGMAKLGHAVLVIAAQDYTSQPNIDEFNRTFPCPVIALPKRNAALIEALARLWLVTRWVQRWKPDVILSSGERSNWLVYALRFYQRVCWLAIGHGSEFGSPRRWVRLLTRLAFNHADRIICVSRFTRQRMLSIGIRQGHEIVINNGADQTRFHPISPQLIEDFRRIHALSNRFVLLTVGNVTSRKGHDLVIRALPAMLRGGLDVHYLVIGLPTQQPLMEKLAADLGVAECVTFLGNASPETLLLAYNACDIFVMPSRTTGSGDFEGYGIVVTEAALCQKSAIVTRESGLEDAVNHEETGLLVPQEDPNAICEAVLRLAFNRDLLQNLAQDAQHRAQGSQTWEHVVLAYQNLLEEMVRINS